MSPKAAANQLHRMAGAFDVACDKALDGVADIALDEARHLSSGALSTAQLRRMDHPYATRHGGARVPGDPAIINDQTGEFKRTWRVEQDGTGKRLINDSWKADLLDRGTSKMIARPIKERIEERVQGEAQDAAQKALRRFT